MLKITEKDASECGDFGGDFVSGLGSGGLLVCVDSAAIYDEGKKAMVRS